MFICANLCPNSCSAFRIFSRAIVLLYRTTAGLTSDFEYLVFRLPTYTLHHLLTRTQSDLRSSDLLRSTNIRLSSPPSINESRLCTSRISSLARRSIGERFKKNTVMTLSPLLIYSRQVAEDVYFFGTRICTGLHRFLGLLLFDKRLEKKQTRPEALRARLTSSIRGNSPDQNRRLPDRIKIEPYEQ